jgi:hypothetical protein
MRRHSELAGRLWDLSKTAHSGTQALTGAPVRRVLSWRTLTV